MPDIFVNIKVLDIELDFLALPANLLPIRLHALYEVASEVLETVFEVCVKLMHLSHLLAPGQLFRKFIL